MLAKRRYVDNPTITVDGHEVLSSRGIKYLGVWLDGNLRFTAHIEQTATKAEIAARAVARLMPNVEDPSYAKRKLLMLTAKSRLLLATPIWAGGSVMPDKSRKVMEKVNRLSSLRLIRGYRTVSGDAAALLAGSIPLDLEAAEHARL